MARTFAVLGELSYRLGLGPQPSAVPDRRLAEIVETTEPGRALDLGCGTGRNALYLAQHGWQTTGVEFVRHAVEMARSNAAGLPVTFVHGDVTKLPELDIGDGYRLLMDGGCYHMIPARGRDAYVAGVSAAAAPGALLIVVGFTRYAGLGMNRAEVVSRFRGWRLVDATAVPGEEMYQYVNGRAVAGCAPSRCLQSGALPTRTSEERFVAGAGRFPPSS
jgi:SAM-dependent methyltransferase